jgi:hypothetical protein
MQRLAKNLKKEDKFENSLYVTGKGVILPR